MRDLLNVAEVIEEVTYKPNTKIWATLGHDGRWSVELCVWVENSRSRREPWDTQASYGAVFYDAATNIYEQSAYVSPRRPLILVRTRLRVPPFESSETDSFLSWLRLMIKEFEMHELDEWFRHKGELVNDPHKEV